MSRSSVGTAKPKGAQETQIHVPKLSRADARPLATSSGFTTPTTDSGENRRAERFALQCLADSPSTATGNRHRTICGVRKLCSPRSAVKRSVISPPPPPPPFCSSAETRLLRWYRARKSKTIGPHGRSIGGSGRMCSRGKRFIHVVPPSNECQQRTLFRNLYGFVRRGFPRCSGLRLQVDWRWRFHWRVTGMWVFFTF